MKSGHHANWMEKIAIAVGLIAFSGVLYSIDYYFLGDIDTIKKYVVHHVAFLPIHALVLGIIIEEMLTWRERRNQRRKLNLFLGMFFRQMGVDFYVTMVEMVANRDALEEEIVVERDWNARRFRQARQKVRRYALEMDADPEKLFQVFRILREREQDIVDMTRNPNLWDFEDFYRTLVALFHLIEESRFHGQEKQLSQGVREHLARDVGRSLRWLLVLWLQYLEFLRGDHPVLFSYQAGVHNTVEPLILEDRWNE